MTTRTEQLFYTLLLITCFLLGGCKAQLPLNSTGNDTGVKTKNNDTLVIRKKYNLRGDTIKLPQHCVLIIKGGCFKNGTVDLNGARIISDDLSLVFPSAVNVKTGSKIPYCTPFWFGAAGNGKKDDTYALNKCAELARSVNLCGDTFACSTLNLSSDTKIYNGRLLGITDSIIIKGARCRRITLDKVIVDGCSRSSIGVFCQDCNEIDINECVVNNIDAGYNQAAGLFIHRSDKISVENTVINNIVSRPNGIIGDDKGSSTGILLELCNNVSILKNKIFDLYYSEDADGIHCNTGVDSEINYKILISENEIYNCAKRCIKIQQRGVTVDKNLLYTTADFEPINSAISIYSSNCSITNNKLYANTPYPIIIDTKWKHENIRIANNVIKDVGRKYQGTITVLAKVDNLQIDNNTIDIEDKNQSAIYIRNNSKNTRINGNSIKGGLSFLWLRLDENNSDCHGLNVMNNTSENADMFIRSSVKSQRSIRNVHLMGNNVTGINDDMQPKDPTERTFYRGIDFKNEK